MALNRRVIFLLLLFTFLSTANAQTILWNYSLTDTPEAVDTGELDGDGQEDLGVAIHTYGETSGSILALSANGTLIWDILLENISSSEGFTSEGLVVADANNDSEKDIILSSTRTGGADNVFALAGTNGSTLWSMGTGNCHSISYFDVHDDGYLDLFIGHSVNLSLYDGVNQDRVWSTEVGSFTVEESIVADADNMSGLEVITSLEYIGLPLDYVSFFNATGDLYSYFKGNNREHLEAADLDGDGLDEGILVKFSPSEVISFNSYQGIYDNDNLGDWVKIAPI